MSKIGRGVLRVYLGAAPGVGKTYAMLDEGHRRQQRGADVVVAVVETHGRAKTIAQIGDLEIVPRRVIEHRGTRFEELDLDAVLARRPAVALVDELAHTNIPGSRHIKRWEDVNDLLAAGIDVVTTLNIQHLESLNDVVEKITGVAQRETVPDSVVRAADQIELVDMSPEALRRRMAHGNIYPAGRIDAALGNYFRPGNLGALRELALLWAADRVEDALVDYRSRQGITDVWETRERIVVALSGESGGDVLIRRASRVAAKSRSELIGVYVRSGDGLRGGGSETELARQQKLIAEVGGTYVEVIADNVGRALADVARSRGATQLVLGSSHRSRLTDLLLGSVIRDTTRRAGGIDIHIIATDDHQRGVSLPKRRRWRNPLSLRRQLLGWAIALIGLPLMTAVLVATASFALATDLLVCLLVVVVAGAVGGLSVGLGGAVFGSLLINYYRVPPTHTFTISERENLIALVVFVAVAGTVSTYVNVAAFRAAQARRARAEAEALARSVGTLALESNPIPALLNQLLTVFDCQSVELRSKHDDVWISEARAAVDGVDPVDAGPKPLEVTVIDVGERAQLILTGPRFGLDDRLTLRSHADQLAVALRDKALRGDAAKAAIAREADEVRTALLQAVSHDLRTPLAGIKASVTSLLSPDVDWPEDQRVEFLETVDAETDRLTRLVGNLLDMSRLQAGVIATQVGTVLVDDVVANALASMSCSTTAVEVSIPDEALLVLADAELLERAVANVLSNAIAWSPPDAPIVIDAVHHGDRIHLRVLDSGPGIAQSQRSDATRPFQQLGDRGSSVSGVGLGLAVATGFVTAMGGLLTLGDSPTQGLAVTFDLPSAVAIDDPRSHGCE